MPTTLRVGDMSCDGCEDIVQTALEEVSGVESASTDHETGTAVVDGEPEIEDLIDAVDYSGYSAELVSEEDTSPDETDAETEEVEEAEEGDEGDEVEEKTADDKDEE